VTSVLLRKEEKIQYEKRDAKRCRLNRKVDDMKQAEEGW
jgi:hypothetical protein